MLTLFLGVATDRSTADDSKHTFRIPSPGGEFVEVEQGGSKLTVVCFLGVECPLARLYGPRLSKLADEMAEKGVRFVGINSNTQDSMPEIRRYVLEHELSFPVGRDHQNSVADRYGATRTPEVFVLDADLSVRYQGRIDDQYEPGIARASAQRHDLRIALQELLAGKSVSVPHTEAPGCLIGRVRTVASGAPGAVTFSNRIAAILHEHCVECHRPGEIGPFSLTDYDEIVGWADTIVEVVDDGRMPPWHASPEHGHFANARFMPDEDRQALKDWVAAGAPAGDLKQVPAAPTFSGQWRLPEEPDIVLPMRDRPFTVPAHGTVEYQYFVVDPGLEEDTWVRNAQILPGNRSVVHHAIVFVRPPDGTRFRGVGWLTAYVPGQRPLELPETYARKVPAGSKLVFQMHYTPSGTEQTDLTRVGLLLADDQKVTHEVITLVGIEQEFEIPPNTPDFEVESRVPWFPPQGELLAISPHMHLRGRSFQASIRDPKQRTTLLDVPRYDFNWQHSYQFTAPLPLSSVEALEFKVTFDNSTSNPVNPDPSEFVFWGEQTWEEMAVAFFEIAEPRDLVASTQPASEDTAEQAARRKRIDKFVADFLKRLDANGDGVVRREEAPLALRAWAFWRFDRNGDGRATRSEIRQAAETRIR